MVPWVCADMSMGVDAAEDDSFCSSFVAASTSSTWTWRLVVNSACTITIV